MAWRLVDLRVWMPLGAFGAFSALGAVPRFCQAEVTEFARPAAAPPMAEAVPAAAAPAAPAPAAKMLDEEPLGDGELPESGGGAGAVRAAEEGADGEAVAVEPADPDVVESSPVDHSDLV